MTLRRTQNSTGCYVTVRICKQFFALIKHLLTVLWYGEYPHIRTYQCTIGICSYANTHSSVGNYAGKFIIKRSILWKSTGRSIIPIEFLSAADVSLWLCNGDRGEEGNRAEVQEGCSGWEQCPTNSTLPQIWSKLGALGQVLCVSQWSQIIFVQGIPLWPTERNTLVCCKPVT